MHETCISMVSNQSDPKKIKYRKVIVSFLKKYHENKTQIRHKVVIPNYNYSYYLW